MICFKQPVIAIHQSDHTNNDTVRVRLVKFMVTVANDGVLFSTRVFRTALIILFGLKHPICVLAVSSDVVYIVVGRRLGLAVFNFKVCKCI